MTDTRDEEEPQKPDPLGSSIYISYFSNSLISSIKTRSIILDAKLNMFKSDETPGFAGTNYKPILYMY